MKACTFGIPATCTRNASRKIPTANSPKPIRLNDISRFPCSAPIFLRIGGFLCRPRLVVGLSGRHSLGGPLFKTAASGNGSRVSGSPLTSTECSPAVIAIPNPFPRIAKTRLQTNPTVCAPWLRLARRLPRIAEASLLVGRDSPVDGLHGKHLFVVYGIFNRDKKRKRVDFGCHRAGATRAGLHAQKAGTRRTVLEAAVNLSRIG